MSLAWTEFQLQHRFNGKVNNKHLYNTNVKILEEWNWLVLVKECIEYLLYTLLTWGPLTGFSLIRQHLNTLYLRHTQVGKCIPKRNMQYNIGICLIKVYTTLWRKPHLPFPLFNKSLLYSVEYGEVETPALFLNVRKYGACYLYFLWVACYPVFGKTNRITYCEWLRTELHYQSSAWLCANSVGHSGHFGAYEYFRQEGSLKASWWINTRKEDGFMFYSYLLKHYGHYYTPMRRCLFKQKAAAPWKSSGSLYHKLILE